MKEAYHRSLRRDTDTPGVKLPGWLYCLTLLTLHCLSCVYTNCLPLLLVHNRLDSFIWLLTFLFFAFSQLIRTPLVILTCTSDYGSSFLFDASRLYNSTEMLDDLAITFSLSTYFQCYIVTHHNETDMPWNCTQLTELDLYAMFSENLQHFVDNGHASLFL